MQVLFVLTESHAKATEIYFAVNWIFIKKKIWLKLWNCGVIESRMSFDNLSPLKLQTQLRRDFSMNFHALAPEFQLRLSSSLRILKRDFSLLTRVARKSKFIYLIYVVLLIKSDICIECWYMRNVKCKFDLTWFLTDFAFTWCNFQHEIVLIYRISMRFWSKFYSMVK